MADTILYRSGTSKGGPLSENHTVALHTDYNLYGFHLDYYPDSSQSFTITGMTATTGNPSGSQFRVWYSGDKAGFVEVPLGQNGLTKSAAYTGGATNINGDKWLQAKLNQMLPSAVFGNVIAKAAAGDWEAATGGGGSTSLVISAGTQALDTIPVMVAYDSGSLTWVSSRFQIATDALFTDILEDSQTLTTSGTDVAFTFGASANLAIGSTTANVATDAFFYPIDSTGYYKAADAAGVALSNATLPNTDKYGAWLIQINTSGTKSTKADTNGNAGYTSLQLAVAAAQALSADANNYAIGYVIVFNSTSASGTFTGGTTSLRATGVYAHFYTEKQNVFNPTITYYARCYHTYSDVSQNGWSNNVSVSLLNSASFKLLGDTVSTMTFASGALATSTAWTETETNGSVTDGNTGESGLGVNCCTLHINQRAGSNIVVNAQKAPTDSGGYQFGQSGATGHDNLYFEVKLVFANKTGTTTTWQTNDWFDLTIKNADASVGHLIKLLLKGDGRLYWRNSSSVDTAIGYFAIGEALVLRVKADLTGTSTPTARIKGLWLNDMSADLTGGTPLTNSYATGSGTSWLQFGLQARTDNNAGNFDVDVKYIRAWK